MEIPPFVLCWYSDLCHWLLLSHAGTIIWRSDRGFATEKDALADFRWRFAT